MKQERISGLTEEQIAQERQKLMFELEDEEERLDRTDFPGADKEREKVKWRIKLIAHNTKLRFIESCKITPNWIIEKQKEATRDLLIRAYN